MARRTSASGRRSYTFVEAEDAWPATDLLARGEAWSVTTILGVLSKAEPLLWWASKLEREYVLRECVAHPPNGDGWLDTMTAKLGRPAFKEGQKGALDLGSQAHARIEWESRRLLGIDAGPAPAIVEGAELAVMAWQDWMKGAEVEVLHAELSVYSLSQRYAGTVDAIMRRADGTCVLVDYKSAKGLYPEHELQVAAYRAAAIEMGLMLCTDGAAVVKLPKTLEQIDEPNAGLEVRWLTPSKCDEHMRAWPHIYGAYEWTRRTAR